jgi:hypothetical protein
LTSWPLSRRISAARFLGYKLCFAGCRYNQHRARLRSCNLARSRVALSSNCRPKNCMYQTLVDTWSQMSRYPKAA